MLELAASGYRLAIDPRLGGSVARFDWHDQAIMRPSQGPSILDSACFPLVPFSNRIACGNFIWEGREIQLPPNMTEADPANAIHGYGWLMPWTVEQSDGRSARLALDYPAAEWPWHWQARQDFVLGENGLTLSLSVRNLSNTAMPAGLGFHPFFPRTERTICRGLHRGEWHNTADCLPLRLDERPTVRDWWEGQPVQSRSVDTVYTGRRGNLEIRWPERNLALQIAPCENLPFTVVYTPKNEDFFCVEPVSQMTDAFNQPEARFAVLAPGESFAATVVMTARFLDRSDS